MNVLLLRPDPGNERFGLGPFFRVEPLGLEYVAADLRFRGTRLSSWIRRMRPRVVGISAMHALEFDRTLETARAIRRVSDEAFILVGGHAAAAYPAPLEDDAIDATCVDDGEEVVPALADALDAGRPLATVPALRLRTPEGWVATSPLAGRTALDRVKRPARELVERHRNGYHCLLFKQVRPSQVPYLTRVLLRTQRMMNRSYLREHEASDVLALEILNEAEPAS